MHYSNFKNINYVIINYKCYEWPDIQDHQLQKYIHGWCWDFSPGKSPDLDMLQRAYKHYVARNPNQE